MKQIQKVSISVIVPVYNEAVLLSKSVMTINNFMQKNFSNYEIIIVESGSKDGSKEITDHLRKKLSNIKVFHQRNRQGVGSALKLGCKKASKDFIWFMDLDIPYPLQSIISALPYLEKYECTLSYRVSDPRRKIRLIQSFIYNTLVKIILELPFKHVNSAFKVFKKNTIKNMTLISNGWIIEAEILYQIKKKGLSYIEIPVPLIDRTDGKSKITIFTFLGMLRELVKLRQKTR